MSHNIETLNHQQRKAIGKMAVHAESVADMTGVYRQTIDFLMKKRLIEIAPGHNTERVRYRLTSLGDDVYDHLYRANRIPQ